MRRLAVIVDTFPRWSERFIARELRELARRGVDFSVFCLKAGNLPDDTDADWHGLIERRVVLPSSVRQHRFRTGRAGGGRREIACGGGEARWRRRETG